MVAVRSGSLSSRTKTAVLPANGAVWPLASWTVNTTVYSWVQWSIFVSPGMSNGAKIRALACVAATGVPATGLAATLATGDAAVLGAAALAEAVGGSDAATGAPPPPRRVNPPIPSTARMITATTARTPREPSPDGAFAPPGPPAPTTGPPKDPEPDVEALDTDGPSFGGNSSLFGSGGGVTYFGS